MTQDPVLSDLNRHLDEQSRAEAWEDAKDKLALQLRGEWWMQIRQDTATGEWYWAIMEDLDCIADEWCKTEQEAWTGMREGLDRKSRKAAEKFLKEQETY